MQQTKSGKKPSIINAHHKGLNGMIGQVLEKRFLILHPIDEGAYGEIFLATD